ncbi:MAG: alkaline phosphatase family protein [Puniceicoccaceae bacterium]|nr:MAG: alkaline phosphatase family protein [Puniceicoccaceae bacterium]
MLLEDRLAEIEGRCGRGAFLRPDYGRLNFARIPTLVENLLGLGTDAGDIGAALRPVLPKRPARVVTLMIDGFGWHQWQAHAERHEALRRIRDRGLVLPLTAVFPSTTAASVTAINSGLTPQEHGLMEWYLYLEELDEVIVTLPFKSMRPGAPSDELARRGHSARLLFDGRSLHRRLREAGVHSRVYLRNNYARSAYSTVSQDGAEVTGYESAAELFVLLRGHLRSDPEPCYHYIYWDAIDHVSHHYRPHSEVYLAELNSFAHLLRTELLDAVEAVTARETTLLVTADHGHVAVDPARTHYLNDIPGVGEALAVSPGGRVIHPWGSPRDCFLQVRKERLDEIHGLLRTRLAGRAEVVRAQEEADAGLFGIGPEHPRFRARIGNLLILPHEDETVWYQHPGQERPTLHGLHGGLSREEMTTLLAASPLAELRG